MPDSYAVLSKSDESRGRDFENLADALINALHSVREGETVCVVHVTGDAELFFTPLCVISPPEVPA